MTKKRDLNSSSNHESTPKRTRTTPSIEINPNPFLTPANLVGFISADAGALFANEPAPELRANHSDSDSENENAFQTPTKDYFPIPQMLRGDFHSAQTSYDGNHDSDSTFEDSDHQDDADLFKTPANGISLLPNQAVLGNTQRTLIFSGPLAMASSLAAPAFEIQSPSSVARENENDDEFDAPSIVRRINFNLLDDEDAPNKRKKLK